MNQAERIRANLEGRRRWLRVFDDASGCCLKVWRLTHGDGLQTVDSKILPLSAAVPESSEQA